TQVASTRRSPIADLESVSYEAHPAPRTRDATPHVGSPSQHSVVARGSTSLPDEVAQRYPSHARRRRISGSRKDRFGVRRIQPGLPAPRPIEEEKLCEVVDDFPVLEDEAGIAVLHEAFARPVVAADNDPVVINDDPLGVRIGQYSNIGQVDIELLHH